MTKSVKKTWTNSDDLYLTTAVENGLPSTTIAKNLDRTLSAVQTRRHLLKNSLVKQKTSSNYTELASSTPDGLKLLTLETGLPIPNGRASNEKVRSQLRKLFENMKVGQSFVVPRKFVYVGHYLVNSEFEAYRIRTTALSKDKEFFRIFRIA